MRLIDADALRDKIIQRTIEEDTEFPEYDWGTGLSIAKDILDRMPTVDAVPVQWLYDLAEKKEEEKDIKLSAMIKGVVALWHREKQNDSD